MAIQNNVTVDMVVAAEATYGVSALAGASDARIIRRVSSTLNVSKDSFTSPEVRADQQIADMRHGTKRPAGAVEGVMAVGAYDPEMEASMRGTWAAGTTATEADFTSVTGTGSTLVFAGGDPVAKGFRVGDVVRLTGNSVAAANRAVNFRITGFGGSSNRTVTVSPAPTAMASVSSFGFVAPGRKVLNGVVRRSFTIEQRYAELDISELFTGMRVGGVSFRLPPTGIATVSIEYQGQNGVKLEGAAAPFFSAPAAQGTTGALAAVNGALRVNGADVAIVTALDFAIANGLSSTPVVGSDIVPEIFYGSTVITGTLSAYFADGNLVDAFLNETEFDIVSVFEAAGVAPREFLAFNIQRAKFSGNSKSIGADGGVILSLPWQALVRVASAGYDTTTMSIQRSNL